MPLFPTSSILKTSDLFSTLPTPMEIVLFNYTIQVWTQLPIHSIKFNIY